jgi:hypothetical protein
MEVYYDSFEIAFVSHGFQIFDAESYERRYLRRDGQPLARGYYVVNWPEHIRARRFDENAEFYGPFKTRREAHSAIESVKLRIQVEAEMALAYPDESIILPMRMTA